MTKKLSFIIPLMIYPFDVLVSMGESNAEVEKWLKSRKITREDIDSVMFDSECVKGRACMFQSGDLMLRLKAVPETNHQYGGLQHEIFHCVTFLMEHIGCPLEVMKSDEPYAYLIQYLTKVIYDNLDANGVS